MKIGIIGGGQLALMMCESSPQHEYYILEKSKDCPCKDVATILVGEYSDEKHLNWLLDNMDVITYEFENIDYKSIEKIKSKTLPNPTILKISQNRLIEKNMAKELGLKTPAFFPINSIDDLKEALEALGGKGVLKTTTGGYDGKGQCIIKNHEITNDAKKIVNSGEAILEEFLEIVDETSVIGCRDKFGNFKYSPLTFNIHKDNILFETKTGYKTNHKPSLVRATKKIMETLDVVGTLAVEFIITKKGWFFNEMAPRPHNSGHWTIEGNSVSQFKNHINAITGKVIQVPKTKRPTTMINLLGKDIDKIKNIKQERGIYIHDYHKSEARAKRKMGHITISAPSVKLRDSKAKEVKKILGVNND